MMYGKPGEDQTYPVGEAPPEFTGSIYPNVNHLSFRLYCALVGKAYEWQQHLCTLHLNVYFHTKTLNTHPLLKSLRSYVDFSEEDFLEFLKLLEPFKLKKNALFYEAGTIPKYSPFILKGCMRQYYITDEGEEKTVQFIEEGTWAGQIGSMRSRTPTNLNLQALEYCDILGITIENADYGLQKFPAYQKYFVTKYPIDHARMIDEAARIKSSPPEILYQWMLKEKPSILNRVPQQYIASYLGIRPETLSRIRNKISQK